MQLDEQVTEGTKHRSIRVDMHGTYGVMALFKKKYGKKNGIIEPLCYFFIVDFSFKMYVEIDHYQKQSSLKKH